MSRLSEWIGGRFARDRVLFSGKRRNLTSMEVRGVQMADELGGVCCRARHLHPSSVAAAQALVWVVEPDLRLVKQFEGLTPQFFDPINPRIDETGVFHSITRSFQFLLLNTRSSIAWMGPPPERGWTTFVIPHHHCNRNGYRLPVERVEQPRRVGYVGQQVHLHDREAIEDAVRKMGMELACFDDRDLQGYRQIDLGIAWTRRDGLRDQCRSNIKLANFASHGIPSVVCDYESYRDTDAALGGGSTLIRSTLPDFIEGIAELVSSHDLRRTMNHKAEMAQARFGRAAIGDEYRKAIEVARATSLAT